jgi:hypothetical protein
MKKILLSFIIVILGLSFSFAQQTTGTEPKKEKDIPVIAPFEGGVLIDNHTCVVPTAKTLEFLIQHRFGNVSNGIEDVYGIYSSANIRLGLNYSILNNLMVGYGLTRTKMISDFQVKWNIFQQTRKNTMPVAVTLYGNALIDGSRDQSFMTSDSLGAYVESSYKFSDRFAYFAQLIVSRKFNDMLSLQATASFTHYNKVKEYLDHDKIGFGINGRIKFSPQSSFIFQYDMPLSIKGISEQREFINAPHTNVALGYEVSTGTHVFQIYISNGSGIVPQENYMYNGADPRFVSNWRLGFTMTRLWGF